MAPCGRWFLAAACLGLCATGQQMYMSRRRAFGSASGMPCGHNGLRCPNRCLEVVPLYGNLDAYGYYFADLWVGSPEQRVSAIVDTTSHLFSFACTTCEHCGKHIDPAFNPSASRSAAWMTCRSDSSAGCPGFCSADGKCSYNQSFEEGSAIMATYLTEHVRIGNDRHGTGLPKRMQMACHDREEKQFFTQKVNGFLGLGAGRPLASLSRLPGGCSQRMSFSLCLSEWGGQLQFPGVDAHGHEAHGFLWTPLTIVGGKGYLVHVNAINVGGRNLFLGQPPILAQLDSGTTFTYMPSRPYLMLRSIIESHCAARRSCGGAIRRGDHCWYLPEGPRGLNHFPPIFLQLGNSKVTWRPQGYLYRIRSSTTWCYAFENDGPNARMVLGLSFFLHREIVFDVSGSRLGFKDAHCPIIKERAPALAPAGGNLQVGPLSWHHGGSGAAALRGMSTTTTMPPWRAAVQRLGLAPAPRPAPYLHRPAAGAMPYAVPGGRPGFYPGGEPFAHAPGGAGPGWNPGMMTTTTADPAKEQAEEVLSKVKEVGDVVEALLNDNATLNLQHQLGPLLHRLPRWGSLASSDMPPEPAPMPPAPAPAPAPMMGPEQAASGLPPPFGEGPPPPPREEPPREGHDQELPLPEGVSERKLAIVGFAVAAGAVLMALFFAGVAFGALSHARMARSGARELRDSLLQGEGDARAPPPPVEMEAVLPKPAYAQPTPVLAPAASSAEAVAFAQQGEAAEDGGVL